jgi:hypothetical protein
MTPTNREPKPQTHRKSGRFGWGIILGLSLLLFLLPGNYTPTGLPPDVWLVMMVGILLLFSLGLFLGVGLLVVCYLPFFQQIKGPLLLLVLLMIGLRSFAYLQTFTDLGWPASQLFLLLSVWLLVLIGALPLVLGVYLWYQDRAVRLWAITLLAVVWLLVAYTRWRGPEQIFQDTFQGELPAELFGLICFGQLVFVLAPLFFIGHSLCLLYREWTRADML